MKKLYHISADFKNTIETFIPRIPVHRCGGEDDKINRICTSSTLEGCLIGHPNMLYHIIYYPEAEYFCPYQYMDYMTTLLDHNEDTGFLLKVYEFEVEDEYVVTDNALKSQNLVPDAYKSQEHWITKEISANRIFYLFIRSASVNEDKTYGFEYEIFDEENLGKLADGDYHYWKQNEYENQRSLEEFSEEKQELEIEEELNEDILELFPF